jgi:nicotinamidase-related amidase
VAAPVAGASGTHAAAPSDVAAVAYAADWHKRLGEWPLPLPRFRLELATTALLIVDMQYGSVDADHGAGPYLRERYPATAAYYYSRVRDAVIPNTARLLHFFREARRPVVYLTVGYNLPDRSDALGLTRQIDDDLKSRTAGGPMVRRGSHGNTIITEVAPQDGELVLNKTSRGAFNSTSIDQLLRNLGVKGLVVTGVSTECCVATTAHDASDRGYQVLLVEDACTAVTPYYQESSLAIFAAMFGRVANTEEALRELQEISPASHG